MSLILQTVHGTWPMQKQSGQIDTSLHPKALLDETADILSYNVLPLGAPLLVALVAVRPAHKSIHHRESLQ